MTTIFKSKTVQRLGRLQNNSLLPLITFLLSITFISSSNADDFYSHTSNKQRNEAELLKPRNLFFRKFDLNEFVDQQEELQLDNITIKGFIFKNNYELSSNELLEAVSDYIGREISSADLIDIKKKVSKVYTDKGYINSGARMPLIDNQYIDLKNALITIKIIEGGIEDIEITGTQDLQEYILKHIHIDKKKIFNAKDLKKKLLILKESDLIEEISVELTPGREINTAKLHLYTKPSKKFNLDSIISSYGSKSVGTIERSLLFAVNSPFDQGDIINLRYSNTEGSNLIDFSYLLPLSGSGTTVKTSYTYSQNRTINSPFSILDIEGESHSIGVEVRHPLFLRYTDQSSLNFGLGLGIIHQRIADSLGGNSFPISRGTNQDGIARTTKFVLQKDFVFKDNVQYLSATSALILGVDLGSTTDPLFDRGQFVSYQAEAYWLRTLPWNLSFSSNISLQVTDRPVIGSELFAIGGINTIPGYPLSTAIADNGIFVSMNTTIPVYNGKIGKFSISPTLSIGHVWNNYIVDRPYTTLLSTSLLFDYQYSDILSLQLTYGIPLIHVPVDSRNIFETNQVSLQLRWSIL